MPVILDIPPLNVNALELWARSNAEPLTYLVFFGLLMGFGALETVIARAHAPRRRLRRWTTNAILTALWVSAGAAIPLTLLGAADWAQDAGWGVLNRVDLRPEMTIALGFLARSFVSYATHIAMHKIPILWRLHRVHHLDTQLDVSTTARFHPLEAVASAPIAIATVIALGIPPLAVLLYEIFDAAIVVFSHSNIRLPNWLDRLLRLVIVTPNMHRVHHSAFQPETDSNYGATFSFWDRLFGTYRRKPPSELEHLTLGLGEVQDKRANQILWLLISPLVSTTRLRRTSDDGA